MQTDPIARVPSLPAVGGVPREGPRSRGGRAFADTLRQDGAPPGDGQDPPAAGEAPPPLESDAAAIRKTGDGALHVDVLV
jgi:hypothetical protein